MDLPTKENDRLGAPGTVSKILWHFTGGPKGNGIDQCQEIHRKPLSQAFQALCSIVETKKLALGSYREVVTVQVPKRRFNRADKKWEDLGEEPERRQSAPVCCMSDIPIAHLSYHAERYGKIAIGFHRKAPVQAGFNPVFYSLQESPALHALHRGLQLIEGLDVETLSV